MFFFASEALDDWTLRPDNVWCVKVVPMWNWLVDRDLKSIDEVPEIIGHFRLFKFLIAIYRVFSRILIEQYEFLTLSDKVPLAVASGITVY